jgi:hypothetical protein
VKRRLYAYVHIWRTSPDRKFQRILRAINLTRKEEATLYSIARAAEEADVSRRTLYAAVESGKVPFTPIEGMKGTEKAVKLEDVIAWKKNRKPSTAGRKKSDK